MMLWKRGRAYSQELRERFLAAADAGIGVCETARRLQVGVSYVSKVLGRHRQTGETTARPQRCHLSPRLGDLHSAIADHVAAKPDTTISELPTWLAEAHGKAAGRGLLFKTLAALGLTHKNGLTHKKSPSTPPSRRAPTLHKRGQIGVRSS